MAGERIRFQDRVRVEDKDKRGIGESEPEIDGRSEAEILRQRRIGDALLDHPFHRPIS